MVDPPAAKRAVWARPPQAGFFLGRALAREIFGHDRGDFAILYWEKESERLFFFMNESERNIK